MCWSKLNKKAPSLNLLTLGNTEFLLYFEVSHNEYILCNSFDICGPGDTKSTAYSGS